MPTNAGQTKQSPLVQSIIANEVFKGTPQYRSIREIAEEHNVLPSTVYTYRTRLGMRKIIDVANNGQRHTVKVPVPAELSTPNFSERNRQGLVQSYTRAQATTDDLVRSLEHEGIISPVDRLKMLSRMIRVGSPMIKIAAIKAIEDLSKTSEGRVGPPAPLTEEERVARLGRLMLGLGQATVDSAYDATFPSNPEPEAPLQPDTGEVPLSVSEDPGQVPDLSAGTPAA